MVGYITIYYDVLKPSETITSDHYRQQIVQCDRTLKDKRVEYIGRHKKVILQYDNTMSYVAKSVKETSDILNNDSLPCLLYSKDISP